MFQLVVTIILAISSVRTAHAAGSGRAFPIDSENFAIENFQKVNPAIEWDPTNFLIDLSGQYANCKYINAKGRLISDRTTPEGGPGSVYIDTIGGTSSDVNSVNVYISDVINRWMADSTYYPQILESQRVGCSVRPGCSGKVVVACVFSSAGQGKSDAKPVTSKPPNRLTPAKFVERTTRPWPNRPDVEQPFPDEPGSPATHKLVALAFTPDQYSVAEIKMHKKWDRSHYLENMSGFETSCAMIGTTSWRFTKVEEIAREEGLKLSGQYGFHSNEGSTQDALEKILSKFKPVTKAKAIGCSIIPDCIAPGGRMDVVVSCLYEEE